MAEAKSIANAVKDAGRAVERGGRRAKKSWLKTADDTEAVIIAYPLASLMIAAGAGFLFSHLLRR